MTTEPGSARTVAFDPRRYPVTYEYSTANRWVLVVVGLVLAAFGLFFGIAAYTPKRADLPALILATGFFSATGLWLATVDLRTRAILSEHGLAYRGAFLTRSVAFSDLQGWRPTPGRQRGLQIDLRPDRAASTTPSSS